MKKPEISVVMSVYNGASNLEITLESVLSQEGCDFEFIVINDGSTDASGRILDEWAARDCRLQVIHQKNAGLTRALIRGCAVAQGEFIARQDAGDISLPGRLKRQMDRLRSDDSAVAISCHTEFIGPGNEFLYRVELQELTLHHGLLETKERLLRGPSHHGSIMMRRNAYETAGGYREAFYFAQDLDLWTRMVELGRFAVVPEVLLRARLDVKSISSIHTFEQRRLTMIIARAAAARRMGGNESPWLAQAAAIRPSSMTDNSRRLAQGSYFIGCCLRQRDQKVSASYFRDAIEYDPFYWRAWLRYIQYKINLFLNSY